MCDVAMKMPILLEEKELLQGLRFNVVRRKYAKSRDDSFERDVVVFPQAVVVLPFITQSEVLLIKQFRAPLNKFIIEAPAGVVDRGESPEETARRELAEETGYLPSKLKNLGVYTPAPGYSSELIHLFYAEGLEYVGARPEKYEIIEPIKLEFSKVYEMVLRNEIIDMKTSLVVLLYKLKG
ncbi:MAG: NUDIX hydrolase [Desulfurococcaceae archaeon]